MYKRKSLDYHVRKFRKCPFCNLERKRNIIVGLKTEVKLSFDRGMN